MADLFHLTERAAWAAAEPAGEYRLSTRGVALEEEGFIHCCMPHQLRCVAEQFYGDADDLVVLVIDPSRLACEVRYEAAEASGERFPHIYGPVPVHAVTEVIPVSRDHDGRFVLPA